MGAKFRAVLAFMTRLPVPIRKGDFERLSEAAPFFPLVGIVVGLGLYSTWELLHLLQIHTAFIRIPLLLSAYYLICGGIHLDGVADVWDGMNCGGNSKKIFQAMSDSCIGTFGTLGLIVVVGLAAMGVSLANGRALFAAPIVGRTMALLLISIYPPAKSDGLGKPMIDRCGRKTAVFSILVMALIAWLIPKAAAAYLVILVLHVLKLRPFIQRIHGVTGDLIGFSIEMSQWIFLLVIQGGAWL